MASTSEFVWCRTGITAIDAQHQAMFRTIADLLDANFRGHGPDQLDKTVTFLTGYIDYHFQCEETLMRERSYPGLAGHQALHAEFRTQFADMLARVQAVRHDHAEATRLSDELGEWLAAWLVEHIGDADRRMGEFVSAAG